MKKNKMVPLLNAALFAVCLFLACPGAGWAREAIVERVLLRTPSRIEIQLNRRTPYKVIKVDNREVLIAFQNTLLRGHVEKRGTGVVDRVNAEMLEDDVAAFVVSTRVDLDGVKARWNSGEALLTVTLDGEVAKSVPIEKDEPVILKPVPVPPPAGARQENAGQPVLAAENKKPAETSVKMPAPTPVDMGRFSGTTSDILLEMADSGCTVKDVRKALGLSRKGRWQDAFTLLDDYLAAGPEKRCLDLAYFLRAYDFFMWSMTQDDAVQLLKGVELFQDSAALFPDSVYIPYAFAAMGKLHRAMKNQPQARGYFDIVLDTYKNYPGKPELLYEAGRIYAGEGRLEDAARKFEEVMTYYPSSAVFTDSEVEFGKVLFDQKKYIRSLSVLKRVVEENPRKIYGSPGLLLCMGNAYHELGEHTRARKALVKVFNLFPGLKENDIILTKIGDAYAGENHTDKAIAMYRLVTREYPGTEGFVISSMRLADLYKDRAEKEQLYNMIIKDYPDNPLAHMAMMRIAGMEYDAGEFQQAVATLEKLLTMRPGVLKYDIMLLMSKAYESLYAKAFKAGDYPDVLRNYESNRRRVDLLENQRVFLIVGRSYLEGHLFEQAFDKLMVAYKLYDKGKRPQDLIYSLAITMYESGRKDEAVNMFRHYIRRFNRGSLIANAYFYLGKIRLESSAYAKALENFKSAYDRADDDMSRADIRIGQADACMGLGMREQAAGFLTDAVDLLAKDPEKHREAIYTACRKRGEAYLGYAAYVKAAESFAMAAGYAEPDNGAADMRFFTGDAYERGKVIEKAVAAFNEVVSTGDPFWTTMAQDRLRTIEVSEKLSKT